MLISEVMCAAEACEPLPEDIRALAKDRASQRLTPEEARETFDTLLPYLQRCCRDDAFVLQFAQIFEMLRRKHEMLAFWNDVQMLLPDTPQPLYLLMRWYRRGRHVQDGAEHLSRLCSRTHSDPLHARLMVVGLWELHLFSEADAFMAALPPEIASDDDLNFQYATCLKKQGRLRDALKTLTPLKDSKRTRNGVKHLLDLLHQKRRQMIDFGTDGSQDDVLRQLVDRLANPIKPTDLKEKVGGIAFFTGQLGSGGAERQLTRIAVAMNKIVKTEKRIAGTSLQGPIQVYVTTLNAERGGDYFLPILHDAQVKTSVLNETQLPDDTLLRTLPDQTRTLFANLPQNMQENTLKLAELFRKDGIDVAYLWQDGGIYSAAFSALLAGTPRIIANFRGLPPNLRPHLMKPGMRDLYIALAQLPHVSFTSNSAIVAREYERWLDLSTETITVVPNAVQEEVLAPSDEDIAFWEEVLQRTPGCSKTVIGIFRFDRNKRPKLWIEAAARYAQSYADARFVLLGHGEEYEDCDRLVQKLGMQNRIVFAGIRKNVDFFLKKADVLMHLARMEGLPNAVIEAQICGVPVLATPAGGTSEIIQDGVTGSILPSADTVTVAEVADHLVTLLSDPQSLRVMGQAGQEIAAQKYSTPAVLEKTIKLFMRG